MRSYDVVIVGGGPAGSSCAWRLRRRGVEVAVLDTSNFPRDKVCAGWITPQVLEALAIEPAEYAGGRVLQPITGFRTSRLGGPDTETRFGGPVSYGIRRCEFDHYLLRRSGARLELGSPVSSIRRADARWIVNDEIETPMLVGAGGHFCPVARMLNANARDEPVVVAQEIEFPVMRAADRYPTGGDTPELFFCPDLCGYGWCFRKGAYLNIGFGRRDRHGFTAHLDGFVRFLQQQRKVPSEVPRGWRGHAYLLSGWSARQLVGDGVVLVGDAAGLAYPESGEGIRPAVESGLMAAEAIVAAGERYGREAFHSYTAWLTDRFGPSTRTARRRRPIPAFVLHSIAGWLLSRPRFARHVLLTRWFLHATQPALRLS
jgi:flavin-dependent dehydrogenase